MAERDAVVETRVDEEREHELLRAVREDPERAIRDAVQAANVADITYLVQHGASMADALVCAAQSGHLETIEALVRLGADVNAKDKDGQTPLFVAASHGYLKVVELLIVLGADVSVKDRSGQAALSYAKQQGHAGFIDVLPKFGAEATTQDDQSAIEHHLERLCLETREHAYLFKRLVSEWSRITKALASSGGGDADARSDCVTRVDALYGELLGLLEQCSRPANVFYRIASSRHVLSELRTLRAELSELAHLVRAISDDDSSASADDSASDDADVDRDWDTPWDELEAICEAQLSASLDATRKLSEVLPDRVAQDEALLLLRYARKTAVAATTGSAAPATAAMTTATTPATTMSEASDGLDLDLSHLDHLDLVSRAFEKVSRWCASERVGDGVDGRNDNVSGNDSNVGGSDGNVSGNDDNDASADGGDEDAEVPDWFIPSYEVRFDVSSRKANDGMLGAVYHGTWRRGSQGGAVVDVKVKVLLMHGLGGARSHASFMRDADRWFRLSNERSSSSPGVSTNTSTATGASTSTTTGASTSTIIEPPALGHPNVLKLLGASHVGQRAFLVLEDAAHGSVLEFVDGQSSSSAGVAASELWRLLLQAAEGLAHLHAHAIVHGHVRCSNILVGRDGTAKVSDFSFDGVRNEIGALGHSGRPSTLQWTAPELVLRGDSAPSRSSDVYAFGMSIVEAMRRGSPWGDLDDSDVLAQIERGHLPPCPADTPVRVWTLVTKMCAIDPSERVDMREVVTSLQGIASGDTSLTTSLPQNASISDVALAAQTSRDPKSSGEGEDALSPVLVTRTITSAYTSHPSTMTSHNFDKQLMPGMVSLTFAGGLERVHTLAREMRESEALCALVHRRLVSLRAALHSVHALLDADTYAKLVAQFGVVISLAIALFKKLGEKRVLQRVAASRAVREGVQRIHAKIDEVFVAARLGNAPEMVAWRSDEAAAIDEQHARLTDLIANLVALVQGLSSSQVEEALTELQLETTRRLNPRAFINLMQTAIDVVARHIGAEVPVPENIPIWYVSRDDIEIGEQIDIGSFGAVHRAKWGAMRTDVCAKLLFTEGAKAQEQFLAETVWHRLAHPHVIPMLGGCHVGTPLFFISELATQGNLADFLDESPANKQQLWRLFYEAAQGLAYLHGERIVHADIKCNNVLIGNDNKAKLCDFGFAHTRTLSIGKSLKEQPNSARWKAPECMLGYGPEANPSFASDVFSLGMSIIEAKTGNVPWNMVADDLILDEVAEGNGHPRPERVFTDTEWKLVTGMTAFEVADRLTLAQAIDMMGELAREEAQVHGTGEVDDVVMDGADEIKCTYCGKKSPKSSKFCSECGGKLTTQ